ncbi:VOC family protein [Streptomyces sp. NPDC051546]|uniref:VOC family protein n=1 Tax=Streptomyces sp. NPDC051546 TaxID=3365655 RepID=UPI00379B2A4C
MSAPRAHVILAVPDVDLTIAAYEQLGFTGTPAHLRDRGEGIAAVQHGTTTLFLLQPEDAFRQQNPHTTAQPLGASSMLSVTDLPDFDTIAARIRQHAEVCTDHTDDPTFRVIVFRDVNGYLIAISDTPGR